MNLATTSTPTYTTPGTTFRNVSPPRSNERRERDFGIGYGNSSGYASARRYIRPWGSPRFVMG